MEWRQVVVSGLKGYGIAEADLQSLNKALEAFARGRLEAAAKEAANTALPRMKERFSEVRSLLSHHESSFLVSCYW